MPYVNSLGGLVQVQMMLLGWGRPALVERSGLADWEVDAIVDDRIVADWPSPHILLALSRALQVPVRDLVLYAAEGCGLHVEATAGPVPSTIVTATNEELLREVRRRLALGAATGGYLATAGAGSGLQFS